MQLGTAGLLGGNTAYPTPAPVALRQPEPRPSDGKVTWLLLTWALVATILWVYQFTLAASSSDPTTNPLLFARTTQTACVERKWHGGSPLDTYKGSCYCGSDAYCMCTPSLAIDAIIEVWNYKDSGAAGAAGTAGAGALAITGGKASEDSSRGKKGGTPAAGEGTSKAAGAAGAGSGIGQEEGRPERSERGRNKGSGGRRHGGAPAGTGAGGAGAGGERRGAGRVLTAVTGGDGGRVGLGGWRALWALTSSSSSSSSAPSAEPGSRGGTTAAASTAAAALAATLPTVPAGPAGRGTGNSADVGIVLVYRGAPPAGYAIPGGFVEVRLLYPNPHPSPSPCPNPHLYAVSGAL